MNKAELTKEELIISNSRQIEKKFWEEKIPLEIYQTHIDFDKNEEIQTEEKERKVVFELKGKDFDNLIKICTESDNKLHLFLLSVVSFVISKRINSLDFIINTPVFKGEQKENLINTILPLRCQLNKNYNFKDLLIELKNNLIEATKYQNYPLKALFGQEWNDKGIYKISDISSIILCLNNIHDADYTKNEGFKIVFVFQRNNDSLNGEIKYDTSVYSDDCINDMMKELQCVLHQVTENINIPLKSIKLFPEEEIRILNEFNKPVSSSEENNTIQDVFYQVVLQKGDKIAVSYKNEVITYKELDVVSDRIAGALYKIGIKAGNVVVIMMENSIDLITTLLGVLKVGAVYLPVDPKYPKDRIDYLLNDSNSKLILINGKLQEEYDLGIKISRIEELKSGLNESDFEIVNDQNSETAYIIYTSGSTGKPKGIMIEHKNVINLTKESDFIEYIENYRLLMTGSIGFDITTFEIWGTLLNGGTLFLMEPDYLLNPLKLQEELKLNHINVLHLIPQLFNQFAMDNDDIFEDLDYFLVGGDIVRTKYINQIEEKYRNLKIIHMYGPSENTTFATFYNIDSKQHGAIPIGMPIKNTNAYILDSYGQLCKTGTKGDLYINGNSLGRGYINKPEQTNEVFIENPFMENQRMYFTGDVAYWNKDGNIGFVGRKDTQIKIRGFRIEVNEIEQVLLSNEAIVECIVVARKKGDDYELIAYYKTEEDKINIDDIFHEPVKLGQDEVRQFLIDKVPDYMVPRFFIELESIPLNPNGKIDREKLPKPEKVFMNNENYLAPCTELEKDLATIYQDVLDKDKIGITDNFYSLGGDSIKTIQIVSKLNNLGYKVKVKDILTFPTIQELSGNIEKNGELEENQEIEEFTEGEVPLSPIQIKLFENEDIDYNQVFQTVILKSEIELLNEDVKQVFIKLTDYHEMFRAKVVRKQNEYCFNITREHELDFSEYDFKNLDNVEGLIKEKVALLQSEVDIFKGALLKIALFHTSEGDQILIITHHLIIDAVSWRIVMEDIDNLFRLQLNREELTLPFKTSSFKKWVEKLKDYTNSTSIIENKKYWDAIENTFIFKIPHEKEGLNRYIDTIKHSINVENTDLEDVVARAKSMLNIDMQEILLTAFSMGISNVFNVDKTLIALEGHGREDFMDNVNISRTIGWFTNEYPVIFSNQHKTNILRQLKEVKEVMKGIPNKGIDYGLIKYFLSQNNNYSQVYESIPQFSFNYLGNFNFNKSGDSLFEFSSVPKLSDKSKQLNRACEFEAIAMIVKQKLSFTITCSCNQYEEETLKMLAKNIEENLKGIFQTISQIVKEERTPSDFSCKDISVEQLEKFEKQFDIEDIYPLSPMQEGMLFHSLMNPYSSAYFQQTIYKLKGEFDINFLKESLGKLQNRHDILRTKFVSENVGKPLQFILKGNQVEFHYSETSGELTENSTSEINSIIEADKNRVFDLRNDKLMRVYVIKSNDNEYVFIWSIHHILIDGWCVGKLISEFFTIYNSLINNINIELDKPIPYRNYIDWLSNKDKNEAKHYWQNYLEDYNEKTSIPKKPDSNIEKEYAQEVIALELPQKFTKALNSYSSNNNITLNSLILTAWSILLGNYNNSKDILFGAVVSGRPTEIRDVESIIGLFINTLPVRVHIDQDMKFDELVKITHQKSINSIQHQHLSLADIQYESDLKSDLFDHILIFENFPVTDRLQNLNHESETEFEIDDIKIFEQTNYDFNLIVIPGDELIIRLNFNENIYDKEFVRKLGKKFLWMLNQLAVNPQTSIDNLLNLQGLELENILKISNGVELDLSNKNTIHQEFEEIAANNAEKIALSFNGIEMTYAELDKRSDQLANYLRVKGVTNDTIVAVLMDRSLELIVAILGILKAGGAYLSLDTSLPVYRKKQMLADAKAKIVLTDIKLNSIKDIADENTELINITKDEIVKGNSDKPININNSSDLMYVIYTSGSTGKPKGVMIKHQNILNLINYQSTRCNIDFSTVLQFTTISFDVATQEIFSTLLNGGKLIIVDKEIIQDIEKLYVKLAENEVSSLYLPASYIKLMFKDDSVVNKLPSSIKHIIAAGEQLEINDNFKTYIKKNKVFVHNHYGPSETHVVSTLTIEPDQLIPHKPSIGKPIANTGIYILDSNRNILPAGATGEIYITGKQLGRGYIGNNEMNADRFVKLNHDPSIVAYRTGDIGRWLENGEILFAGRKDDQVKIRGFRVEPSEINIYIEKHELIKSAVTIARSNSDKSESVLITYFISEKEVSANEIRKILLEYLPDYMIPSHYMRLESFPLTANKKIDKRNLPEIETANRISEELSEDRTELKLQEICAEILNYKNSVIGIEECFFELGGHSIKAMELCAQISKVFSISIPVSEIFRKRTIRELAKVIKSSVHKNFISINVQEKKEYFPVSSAQKRMFLLNQIKGKDTTSDTVPVVMEIDGHVQNKLIEYVFKELINRHESLRTSFHLVEGEIVQKVNNKINEFRIENISSGMKELPGLFKSLIKAFDLNQAPLIRVVLIKVRDDKHFLFVAMHHIITDGSTMGVLINDFTRLFNKGDLNKLRIQYKDFASWQNKKKYNGEIKRQEEYWINKLDGDIPVLELPLDFQRPETQVFEGDNFIVDIDEDLHKQVKNYIKKHDVTIYMFYMSVLNVLLSKYSGQNDIIVGVPVQGRQHVELEDIVGFFVNTLPLRSKLNKDKTFTQLLEEVHSNLLNLYDNQDFQLEEIIEKLNIEPDPSRNPLFTVVLEQHGNQKTIDNLNKSYSDNSEDTNGVVIKPYKIADEVNQFELLLHVLEGNEYMGLHIYYSTVVYKKETMNKLVTHLINIIRYVINNPNCLVSEIEMFSKNEKEELLKLAKESELEDIEEVGFDF